MIFSCNVLCISIISYSYRIVYSVNEPTLLFSSSCLTLWICSVFRDLSLRTSKRSTYWRLGVLDLILFECHSNSDVVLSYAWSFFALCLYLLLRNTARQHQPVPTFSLCIHHDRFSYNLPPKLPTWKWILNWPTDTICSLIVIYWKYWEWLIKLISIILSKG